jgi:hypothetical protein
MERADALAEERAALTNYMRNTLITNELKFKEVGRTLFVSTQAAQQHTSHAATAALGTCTCEGAGTKGIQSKAPADVCLSACLRVVIFWVSCSSWIVPRSAAAWTCLLSCWR